MTTYTTSDTRLSFTRSHLVVRYHVQRGHHGGVFIVPNYRKILAQCKTLEQPERVQHVAHHTALIALSLGPDVIATEPQSDRLAVHCAVACVIIIDLALLPEFPLDRGTPRPVVSGGSSESDEPDIVVLSEQELEAMAEALIAHNQPSEQAAMANATSVTALGSSLENDQAAEDAEPGEPTEPHAPPHLSLVVSGPENGEIANNDEDEEDDGEDDDDDDDDSDSDDSYYVNEAAKGDVSPLPAYVFEISCLEGMAEESSVVMDSRAVYMCDWDKGVPDGTVDYEDLHEGEVNLDMWEWKIRANCEFLLEQRLTASRTPQDLDVQT